MLKTMVIVLIAAALGGTGHVFLAKGMRPVGDLTEAPSHRLGGMVARAVSNPWLIFGVVLQASFFFIYLTLLSRADVSLVLPLTAVDYIVVAILAQYMLGELVTPARWAGMGLIVAGVGLLSRTSP
jgi:drug/metabolite transporter (DMT)-like permease